MFAAIVPRMMGPETYGRYSLITTLAVLLALLSSLGLTNSIGRFVPQFVHRGERAELQRFVGGLLTLRLLTAAGAAVLYLGITLVWLPDVDIVVLRIMAAALFLQGLSQYAFSLFLGFDEPGRWAAENSLRRWVSLALVVPAFSVGGLRAAGGALLATEMVLLAIGLRWSRVRLSFRDLAFRPASYAPYLRFALLFFANQALFTAFQGSGEPLVRLVTGDYTEVSYFALANNVYLAAAGTLSQVPLALVPGLSRLMATDAAGDVTRRVDRLLTGLTIASMTALFSALFFADVVVVRVIGPAYARAAVNLPVLMGALAALAVSSVSVALAIVHDRPATALRASVIRLLVFWTMGPPLVVWWGGSGGACIAVVAACCVHAAASAWDMRDVLRPALRSAALAAALSAVFVPLVYLKASVGVDVGLFALFATGYAALLFWSGVLTRDDVRALRGMAWRPDAAVSAGGDG